MPDAEKNASKGNGALGCGCLLAIAVCGVFGYGYYLFKKDERATAARLAREDAERKKSTVPRWAWDEATKYVELQLVAPATAKFACPRGEPWSACVEQLAETTYRVDGTVDAQNRLGVPLRHGFSVTLRYVGNQTWMPIEGPTLTGP